MREEFSGYGGQITGLIAVGVIPRVIAAGLTCVDWGMHRFRRLVH